MPRYTAAIFDLDGTLLNTLDDLANAVNYALHTYHFPQRTREEVRAFVGNGVTLLLNRAVPPGTPKEDTEQCLSTFREYYTCHMTEQTVPYPGIPDLLRSLRERGCQTAIVSNKFDAAVQGLCTHYFPGLTDAAAGEGPDIPKKPHPAMVLRVLERLGVPPTQAVYVGDADTDIETAKNAGMDCISVTWGFRDRAFLLSHGAAFLADTPEEVLAQICQA